MLTPPVSMRIFLAAGVTDLRKSFDGLSAAVQQVLARQVLSGEVFLFCNRRRDRDTVTGPVRRLDRVISAHARVLTGVTSRAAH